MSLDRGWTSTTRGTVGTGIEIQRILRSAKRKKKSAIERKRERVGVGSERGCGGVKAEKKEDGRVGGSMVRKRWTAKMEGDETRATVPASRCVYAEYVCVAAYRRDIRRAQPTGCVCFMPPVTSGEVPSRSVPPAFSLALA